MQTNINTVLMERGSRYNKYGPYKRHAEITQKIKAVYDEYDNEEIDPAMREALDMIAHKIGRIFNGDPTYKDNWVDISGYATLVSNDLKDS
jgi:Domain of unknown function (DUF6378)